LSGCMKKKVNQAMTIRVTQLSSSIIQIRIFDQPLRDKTLKWNTAARLPAWIMQEQGSIFPPLAPLFSESKLWPVAQATYRFFNLVGTYQHICMH
jgi:hypothetical protein